CEEVEEEKNQQLFAGLAVSKTKADVSPQVAVTEPVSFPLQSSFISSPWDHGTKSRKSQLDSHPKIALSCSSNRHKTDAFLGLSDGKLVNDVIQEVKALDNEVNCDGKFKGKIELSGAKEAATKVYKEDTIELTELPCEREKEHRMSHTRMAERSIPEHELRRLRNVALRMPERMKVGPAGITQAVVDAIHEKWKIDEVVKLKFEEPLSLNMRRTHEILESKTGGLIIWRSGSSVVLYRGMTYKLLCVQSYTKQNQVDRDSLQDLKDVALDAMQTIGVKDSVRTTKSYVPDYAKYLNDFSKEELRDLCELNHLLDELGPRFRNWTGREPLPVDADQLPPVVPGYKPPFRFLPYGVRPCLRNKEMTDIRRLARTVPPHFALGRNRELQGLAKAMVKLWERSAIAKIAIKHGVENTRNERMAEELKKLTGGILLSRNKDFIVFYRGNDFLPPIVKELLTERQKVTEEQCNEEEQARQIAAALSVSTSKSSNNQLVAGTFAETIAAISQWGKQQSSEDVEEMMRDSEIAKQASLVRYLEKKLAFAKGKLKKAEKALAKLHEYLEPAELPNDLETISDEERFLFRKIGLCMKPYLLLGKNRYLNPTGSFFFFFWCL
ncbi:CRM-domain containing factor CFM3A, chloroplastic/mitochondrial, partial [Carica papaya]|uniref:CRM-domain containing factor CFM3A, chloroplastic/mitochondrial n=1 Tax=Carica papaya TaxID=3649 RepID=UPI000B8CD758